MQILARFLYLAPTAFLLSCDQQPTLSESDLKLGLECFESHRASFPPGTQYEGIETRTDDRLAIRIMDGVEVVTIDCEQPKK